MDIYPAREIPINGVTSEWLLGKIENRNKKLVEKEQLTKEIRSADCEVVIMMGAGDIGEMVKNVEKELRDEN